MEEGDNITPKDSKKRVGRVFLIEDFFGCLEGKLFIWKYVEEIGCLYDAKMRVLVRRELERVRMMLFMVQIFLSSFPFWEDV